MIERFSITNYKSHGSKSTVDLSPSSNLFAHDNHILRFNQDSVLKMSAIFGANSAGKTNLIDALSVLKDYVLGKTNVSSFKKFITKMDESLEIDLVILTTRSNRFNYNLTIYSDGNVAECVKVLYSDDKEEILIHRTPDSITSCIHKASQTLKERVLLFYGGGLESKFNNTIKSIKACNLPPINDIISYVDWHERLHEMIDGTFLPVNVGNNRLIAGLLKELRSKSSIQSWYRYKVEYFSYPLKNPNVIDFDDKMEDLREWFSNTLHIINHQSVNFSDFDEDTIDFISSVITDFDVGISRIYWKRVNDVGRKDNIIKALENSIRGGISAKNRDIISANLPDDCVTSYMYHDDHNFYLIRYKNGYPQIKELMVSHTNAPGDESGFVSESMGTKRLIQFISLLAKSDGFRVYVVDELNYKLHPNLSKHFVELFGNVDNNAQLIFTTHESRVLSTDLLRYDEIHIVDKCELGYSTVKRLSDMSVEIDNTMETLYYDLGVFGGIPKY